MTTNQLGLTVKQLKEALSNYKDDAHIYASSECSFLPLRIIEMDSYQGHLVIWLGGTVKEIKEKSIPDDDFMRQQFQGIINLVDKNNQKNRRMGIRNFLLTASIEELQEELKISKEKGDTFRVDCIQELLDKKEEEDFEDEDPRQNGWVGCDGLP